MILLHCSDPVLFVFRWLDAATDALDGWAYSPLRRLCIQMCGGRHVEVLESVASSASSSLVLGPDRGRFRSRSLPQDESSRLWGRFLGRLLDRPHLHVRAAQLAAAAAQVGLSFALNLPF
jgi:hypothetical protein